MKKIKNIIKAIKAWDEKHTNMHSGIYMNIFLLAAALFAMNLSQASAYINAL